MERDITTVSRSPLPPPHTQRNEKLFERQCQRMSGIDLHKKEERQKLHYKMLGDLQNMARVLPGYA